MRFLLALLSVVVLNGCAGQTPPRGPSPRPNERITGWTEDLRSTPGKEIYLRNNTDRALVITSIIFYQCENIRGGCMPLQRDETLGPGEWRRFATVTPAMPEKSYHFRWRYNYSGIRPSERPGDEAGRVVPRTPLDIEAYEGGIFGFEVPANTRGSLTGQYSGRLALVGDTLSVRVDRGLIRSLVSSGGEVQQLRSIRIGWRTRSEVPGSSTVTYSPRVELDLDLQPEEEVEVGPLDLFLVLDLSRSGPIQFFFAHEVLLDDDRSTYTYSYLPQDLRELVNSLGSFHGPRRLF